MKKTRLKNTNQYPDNQEKTQAQQPGSWKKKSGGGIIMVSRQPADGRMKAGSTGAKNWGGTDQEKKCGEKRDKDRQRKGTSFYARGPIPGSPSFGPESWCKPSGTGDREKRKGCWCNHKRTTRRHPTWTVLTGSASTRGTGGELDCQVEKKKK